MPDGSNAFWVQDTAEGVTTTLDGTLNRASNMFQVVQTAIAGSLAFWGGSGGSSFVVSGSRVSLDIHGGTGPNNVVVGSEDTGTVRIQSMITLSTDAAHPFDIDVDSSRSSAHYILTAFGAPSPYSRLFEYSGAPKLDFAPTQVHSLHIDGSSANACGLEVNFNAGSPLPTAGISPTLSFAGGPSPGSSTNLLLRGTLPTGRFGDERHITTGSGSGVISFSNVPGMIAYSNMSSHYIYDSCDAYQYFFEYNNFSDDSILVSSGPGFIWDDYSQPISFYSSEEASGFPHVETDNKTNIRFDASGGPIGSRVRLTIDYIAEFPVTGLFSLVATTSPGDDAAFVKTAILGAFTVLKQEKGDDRASVPLPLADVGGDITFDGGLDFDVLDINAQGMALTPANFSPQQFDYIAISGPPTVGDPYRFINYEQVNVTNLAAVQPVVTASALRGVKSRPLVDQVVGTFTSAAPGAKASDFLTTIDWGDGSQGAGTIVQDASTPSIFYVMGTHTYGQGSPAYTTHLVVASTGSLLATTINGVPVTFSTPASDPVTAAGTAVIADSALTPSATQPAIPDAREGVRFNDVVVGSFEDLDPNPSLAGYIVAIDWGDGSPTSFGRVVQPGGPGTTLYVLGSHTYADSAPPGASVLRPAIFPPFPLTYAGTFPVLIHVQDSGGSAASLSNTITVQDRPLSVSGGLDPASDSGASNSDAITNVVQPTFRGRASEGGARISLYISGMASTESGHVPSSFSAGGAASADATGEWRITLDGPLPDGVYSVRVQAFDADGPTTSPATTIVERMVVDTVGPRVTGLVFDNRRGRVVAAFQDFGGADDAGVGLNFATIVDANNYRFAPALPATLGPRRASRGVVGGISVDPGTDDGAQAATITINGGRGFRGGRYLFTARSVEPANLTGVQDLAGNALDGEFYSSFPSGNDHVGGDFVAGLDAARRRVFAPKTMIGVASPVTPPRLRSAGRIALQPGRSAPATARKTLAVANPLHARRLAGVNLSKLR
jgi:hypothetical protein